MIGAIAGDVIGSVFERHNVKTTDFPLFSSGSSFTDDTVLTIALADSILSGTPYVTKLKEYYALYPRAGYGGNFRHWARSDNSEPYNSWGNGSAMRVSPIGYAYETLEQVLAEAASSAAVTHNHPEGVKGAQATAAAIFLARQGSDKDAIRAFIEERFGYDLSFTLDEIRPHYSFDVSCQGSVPQALRAFLESNSFEDAVRKAISIGGDSDTIACIAGGIAQALYGVSDEIRTGVVSRLDARLRGVLEAFEARYPFQGAGV